MRIIPLLSALTLTGAVLAAGGTHAGGEQPGTTNPPTVTVGVRKPSGIEGGVGNARLAAFVIQRSGGPLDTGLTVKYMMSGNASNGSDYDMLSEVVEIPAGQDRVTLVVRIIDDHHAEGTESAVLTLVQASGYMIGTPDHQDVTLADNDQGGHTGGGHGTETRP